jgi:hypothetical protein
MPQVAWRHSVARGAVSARGSAALSAAAMSRAPCMRELAEAHVRCGDLGMIKESIRSRIDRFHTSIK